MTSQYRCETCKHFKTRRRVPVKQYVDGDVGECQHPILKKNHYGIEWLRFVINRDLGCASHSSQQSELEIPDILVCQSLPNEHGFCGKNTCWVKGLEGVESGDICLFMQASRKAELRSKGG